MFGARSSRGGYHATMLQNIRNNSSSTSGGLAYRLVSPNVELHFAVASSRQACWLRRAPAPFRTPGTCRACHWRCLRTSWGRCRPRPPLGQPGCRPGQQRWLPEWQRWLPWRACCRSRLGYPAAGRQPPLLSEKRYARAIRAFRLWQRGRLWLLFRQRFRRSC
jgi:hypothetical protein